MKSKVKIDNKIINNKISKITSLCKKNNVIHYRVVGAGAGGYILAFSNNFRKLKKILKIKKILFLPIKIEKEGVRIVDSYNKID